MTAGTYFIGHLLIALAAQKYMILAGRFIGGMGLGFELSCATVYIVEIAATDMRGVCGCLVQFMGSAGILYTFFVGYWLDWINLAIANTCVVFPFIIAMFFVPESPQWLVMKVSGPRQREKKCG